MEKIRGILLVALGAASYGILATFVKVAHGQGYHTSEISLAQIIIGFACLFILNMFRKKGQVTPMAGNGKPWIKLMLAGTSLGLTSSFYYLAVQYLPVSVCII